MSEELGVAPEHPGLAALKELVLAGQRDAPATLDEARALMDGYPQPVPDGTTVDVVDVAGRRGEWLRRVDARAGRAVLFLHGGGYTTGSPRSHRRLAALIGEAAGIDVLTVDYRLAPEHPCPAAVLDAVAAYRWVRAAGFDQVVLAGDSAGGGLAMATMVALRDANDVLPTAAVLLAPWVDLTLAGGSVTTRAEVGFMLTAVSLRQSAEVYAGNRRLDDPLVSPLFADLEGLPLMLIQVGDADLLLDDAARLAERAASSGVDVTIETEPHMPHVYQAFAGLLPEADAAIDRIGSWIRHVIG